MKVVSQALHFPCVQCRQEVQNAFTAESMGLTPQSDPVQILQRFKHFHRIPLPESSAPTPDWITDILYLRQWHVVRTEKRQWRSVELISNSRRERRRRLRRSAHVDSLGKCLYTTCSKEVSFYQPPNTQNERYQRIQSKQSSMIMRTPGCKKLDM